MTANSMAVVEELERIWTDLSPRLGAFQKIVAVRTTAKSGYFASEDKQSEEKD